MRVAMRSLLSRKSQKFSDRDQDQEPSASTPGTFIPPLNSVGERVFPIRNVRGNTEIPWLEPNIQNGTSKHHDQGSGHASIRMSCESDGRNSNQSPRLSDQRSNIGSSDGSEARKISERAQIVVTKQGPGILAGSAIGSNAMPTYRRCEDEPIHTPGAIQNYGALLGLRYTEDGQLEVRIASENTRRILGYGPEQLFALTSFLDVLKDDNQDEMVARIRHALRNTTSTMDETRPDIFQITLTFPYEPETRLWCAMHIAPNSNNMVVCEFEDYVDAFYLKDVRAARNLPDLPVQSTGFDSSTEQFKMSTTSKSTPLPVLGIARQRRNKEFSSLDLFDALGQAQKQITSCNLVQDLLEVVVGIIAELTGFHRVMFYRFDAQMNGCVDAEMLNPQASTDVYRGLHYPASDIPKQARELYKINRIRILHDRDAETARLVCRHESDFQHPLDLTHSYLRAMSPIHNKYLANMGVRSTMSISVVIDAKLWGLIACHGYGDDGIRVSLPIRELCRNIGECAAVNIQQITMRQRIEARRPPAADPTLRNPAGLLCSTSTDLLELVDADFALLNVDEQARAIGKLNPYTEAVAIVSYLQASQFTAIRCSQNINADFPDINHPGGIKTIAGLLLIPLSGGGNNDFLVFFRKSQTKHVKWAGNPYDKKKLAGSEYLEPRSSFRKWVETIKGTSKEWTEDQLDTAWILGLLYGRFIEIWRQRGQGNDGEKLPSIRKSTRELQSPINAITNYVDMALHSATDEKTRQLLGRAQESSTSLVWAMEDLLKLTKLEDKSTQLGDETFNLSLIVSKVMKALQKEAQRKTLDLTISVHDHLPTMVKGDRDRFKQVLAYLIGNAFKQSKSALVDINTIRTKDNISVICITVQDASPGMSETELDNTFQEFEQARDGDDWLFATDDSALRSNGSSKGRDTSLAIIARYVRSVDGQIRVTSEPGKGSIFSLELPFAVVPSSDVTVPRKLRDLFLPPNVSTKFPVLPASASPLRSFVQHQNGMAKQLDAMVPTPVDGTLTPRASNQAREVYVSSIEPRAPGPYHPKSEATSSMSDIERARVSFTSMHVLIAEDNFVSQRMMEKRLSQMGYTVVVASDGQEAHDRFVTSSNTTKVDVILMDMKMPLVDGTLSTRMIRFWEKESQLRPEAQTKQRVPIIAVSTELDDDKRFDYTQNGFDGWIVKPVDFRKLDLVLQGVKDTGLKRDALYVPGQEHGGWFFP